MTIGDRVRLKRLELGLTQEELARMLGYKSKSSIAHIEKGRDIPRSMVVKLAKILRTTPAYLMGWEKGTKKDGPIEINEADRDAIIKLIEKFDQEFIKSMLTLPPEKEDELRQFVDFLASKK